MKKSLLVFSLFLLGSISLASCGDASSSNVPSNIPSETPSETPSVVPSETPTETPTEIPTETPTTAPVVETISEENLDLLKHSFRIDGKYAVNGFTRIFTSIFKEHQYFNNEFYYNDLYPEVVIPVDIEFNILEENGKVYLLQTNPDNTEKRLEYPESFDSLVNPFRKLTKEDITLSDEPLTYNVALDKVGPLVTSLTNWNHKDSNYLKISLNKDTLIPEKAVASMESHADGTIIYEMTFSQIGEAVVPSVVSETLPEHNALKQSWDAFDNTNYTVSVLDHAYSVETDQDVSYKIYRNESIIYQDLDKRGVVSKDNNVYEFSVDETNTAILGSIYNGASTPFIFTPTLDCAPQLFHKESEGVYRINSPYIIPTVISSFAFEENILKLAGYYGYDLRLFVENGVFSGIEFTYNVQDLYGKMTLKVSDNGTTKMPEGINFDGLTKPEGGDVQTSLYPATWNGTYKGTLSKGTINGSSELVIEISADKVLVNTLTAEVLEYNEVDGIHISLSDGNTYWIFNSTYQEKDFNVGIMSDDYQTLCMNAERVIEKEPDSGQPSVPLIPADWIGEYNGTASSGNFNGETAINIKITKDSITVNDNLATIVSYDEYEGFTLNIGNTEYYLSRINETKLAFMDSTYSLMCTNLILKA